MLSSAMLGLLMLVAVTEFLLGLVANGVLAVWSFGELIRKFKGSTYNLLILGLAVCRFFLQWLLLADLCLFVLSTSSRWLPHINTSCILTSQASLWLATYLSVFYCRRITPAEHNRVCMRPRKSSYCLSLSCLLGCLTISLFIIALVNLTLYRSSRGNSSILVSGPTGRYLYLSQLSGLPFMVFLVASGKLIVSLYRHHRKMQGAAAGRRDARAQAHITALKSLGCFLTLHTLYVLAVPFSFSSKPSTQVTSVFLSKVLTAAYPSLHSVVLIMGNSQVKQTCQRILWKAVCAWRPPGSMRR